MTIKDKNSSKTPDTITLHDEPMILGTGGDCHQVADNNNTFLTTQNGVPIADDQNTLKIGGEGPALLEDFLFREKIFHFDHERIPERVVHARGYAAHGFFETYNSQAHLTSAHLFQEKGRVTPAFVRFSTVVGNKGSADLARDVRGFAVKLYTQEGNWDLVGNNIPVFFIQDAIKFPDLIHAAKDEPDRGFPQAQTGHDNFWDFISLTPESMHMVMWIMSDRTLPRSLRFMEGFGVHTFRLINQEGKSTFVKFHWKPKLGMQSVLWDEAVKINGADPDYHRRDLWNAIQSGDYPEWELGLQVFDDKFCEKFPFDVLDPTKLIPEEEIPITIVGRLVLDRCVDNFFAETEQVAFCTQNIVPGIDFSNDPLLQGRNFSYLDTQIKRLGSPNFTHLPINAPKCPFANFQQDGHMAFHNPIGRANYSPNSWHEGPREDPQNGFKSYPEKVSDTKQRARSEKFSDHYSQAQQFFLSQTPIEQKHIIDALVFELSKVEKKEIRERMVSHLLVIDNHLGTKVSQGLGMKSLPKPCQVVKAPKSLPASPKLSIIKNKVHTFAGRRVGVLLDEDVDEGILDALLKELANEKTAYTLIAPNINPILLKKDGKQLIVQERIGGAPSVLFDAVIVLLDGKNPLFSHPKVNEFIIDAFLNLKYIAFLSSAKASLENISPVSIDAGCFELNNSASIKEFIHQCRNLRFWTRKVSPD